MDRKLDARYRLIRPLAEYADRQTLLVEDTLTGRPVVLKSAPLAQNRQEAACLLALPKGIGPAVHDLIWHGPRRLTLVVEALEGRTLKEAIPEIPPAQFPLLAAEICRLLGSVHRTGWIHADLKPDNIFIQQRPEGFSVRLLDFGFAINRFGESGSEERGGTLKYLAPELLKGWLIDSRCDLYSLGVILREDFPGLREDPSWQPVLEKLCSDFPARRYAHAGALIDELAAIFGSARAAASSVAGDVAMSESPAVFGAGPMWGRQEILEDILTRARAGRGQRILLQARPGMGLTRVLHEVALAAAGSATAAKAPAVRTIDLPSTAEPQEIARVAAFLRKKARSPETIVLGIGDPSPGLWWPGHASMELLLSIVNSPEWTRLSLDPLDDESLGESLGTLIHPEGNDLHRLAGELNQECEGDLRLIGSGIAYIWGAAGREDGPDWKLDPQKVKQALDSWSPAFPPPFLAQAPADLLPALKVAARVGQMCPLSVARDLLAAFALPGSLDALLDHGYLQSRDEDRLEFVTRSLRQEAFSAGPESAETIDRWLHEHYQPSPERVKETIEACHRARRLGDLDRESEYLAAAMESVLARFWWPDAFLLMAYPELPPRTATKDWIRRRCADLPPILGSNWSDQRLLYLAGRCLGSTESPTADALLYEAAGGSGTAIAVQSNLSLAERAAWSRDGSVYERCLEHLRRLEEGPEGTVPGVIQYLEAHRAMVMGRAEEALEKAREASRLLRNTREPEESMNLQVLAILQFNHDPEGAKASLLEAVETTRDPGLLAQSYSNLAMMHGLTGRPDLGAACADEGIRRTRRQISTGRLTVLRQQRAWNWVDNDQIERAWAEAMTLLQTPTVRTSAIERTPIRIMLSYCSMHRGHRSDSIREAALAWQDSRTGGVEAQQSGSLQSLVDVLLEFEAWDFVRDHPEDLCSLAGIDHPEARCASARARALLAQAHGAAAEAVGTLECELESSQTVNNHQNRARYHHHLGTALLASIGNTTDRAKVQVAAQQFESALALFSQHGDGYFRARSLLGLAEARRRAGDRRGASRALTQSINLARKVQSPRVLALGLHMRAQARMDGL